MKRVVFLYKDVKMGCIVDQVSLSTVLLKQGININDIEIIEVDFEEAIQMIMNDEIICNSSIGAILKVARMQRL